MCLCICVSLSACLSVNPSAYPLTSFPIPSLPICPPVRPSVHPPMHPSIHTYINPPVHPRVHQCNSDKLQNHVLLSQCYVTLQFFHPPISNKGRRSSLTSDIIHITPITRSTRPLSDIHQTKLNANFLPKPAIFLVLLGSNHYKDYNPV